MPSNPSESSRMVKYKVLDLIEIKIWDQARTQIKTHVWYQVEAEVINRVSAQLSGSGYIRPLIMI